MRRLLAAITLLFATAITSRPALAQSFTWTPPVDLSSLGSQAVNSAIALSSDGARATAVWSDSKTIMTSSATIIAGVPSWGAVTVLASGGIYNAPTVRVSTDGTRATAFWAVQKSKTVVLMQSSSATISGNVASWGAAVGFSVPSSSGSSGTAFALSEDGTTGLLVWAEAYAATVNGKSVTNTIIKAASASISGTTSTWGRATRLSAAGQNAKNATVALSSSGTSATALWERFDGKTDIVQARSGVISGTTSAWGSVTDLSAVGFFSNNPQVAVSADGTRATAVWSRSISSRSSVVRTRSATISGTTATWGASAALSPMNKLCRSSLVALSADGARASAAWVVDGSVYSASATIAGDAVTWGSSTQVSLGGGGALLGSLAMSSDGSKAFLAWRRKNNSIYVVQTSAAALNGNAQSWGAVADVSDSTLNALDLKGQLSADGATAATIWKQIRGASGRVIQSSVGSIVHPTPTPTPLVTDTPTPTPTPAATATPVGRQGGDAPVPNHSSNDGRVVLRLRDSSAKFRRDYYGYLLRASDQKLVSYGKFKVSRNRGTLVLNHIPAGEYLTFSVVFRAATPKVISSRYRRITVK